MRGIFDKRFMEFLENVSVYNDGVNWSAVDQYFSMIQERRAENYRDSAVFLSYPVSISNLIVVCNLSIAFGLAVPYLRGLKEGEPTIYSTKKEDNLLPPTWINDKVKPNPNLVLLQMFCQSSNMAQSIVQLCELGQDHSARILLRSLDELCQMILIITRDRADFRTYAVKQEGVDYTAISFKYFSKKKRGAKLAKIEEEIGRNAAQIEISTNVRDERFSRFSSAVHSAPLSALVGSMVWSFREDKATLGLLGGCNRMSNSTLSYFAEMYDEFFRLFFGIIEDIHELQFPEATATYWNNSKAISLLLHETLYHSEST